MIEIVNDWQQNKQTYEYLYDIEYGISEQVIALMLGWA